MPWFLTFSRRLLSKSGLSPPLKRPFSHSKLTLYPNEDIKATVIDPESSLKAFYGEELEVTPSRIPPPPIGSLEPPPVPIQISAVNLETIISVISNECNAELTTFFNEEGQLDKLTPANILLCLESKRERVGLAESLIKKFRKLLKGKIGHDGLDAIEPDWIIVDLRVAMVHIFSPIARIEYGIDEKLKEEIEKAKVKHTEEALLEEYATSLPRKMAGDPMRRHPPDESSTYDPFV